MRAMELRVDVGDAGAASSSGGTTAPGQTSPGLGCAFNFYIFKAATLAWRQALRGYRRNQGVNLARRCSHG